MFFGQGGRGPADADVEIPAATQGQHVDRRGLAYDPVARPQLPVFKTSAEQFAGSAPSPDLLASFLEGYPLYTGFSDGCAAQPYPTRIRGEMVKVGSIIGVRRG